MEYPDGQVIDLEEAMRRVEARLKKIQARVEAGRLNDPAKIGAAVERSLQRNHGYRYFAWKLKDGQLRFFEHPVNFPREKKYEGKYLIQTDQIYITPQEAVAYYKELNEVERAFHSLKDPIGMRPIHHRSERRFRAHIFVAALTFLLEGLLEHDLKKAGVQLSTSALKALQTIRHVSFRVDGPSRIGVTPGSARARQVLKAMQIVDPRPPTPPPGDETTM